MMYQDSWIDAHNPMLTEFPLKKVIWFLLRGLISLLELKIQTDESTGHLAFAETKLFTLYSNLDKNW